MSMRDEGGVARARGKGGVCAGGRAATPKQMGHALKELHDLLHDDVLDVDLVLVVEVLGGEGDLRPGRGGDETTGRGRRGREGHCD